MALASMQLVVGSWRFPRHFTGRFICKHAGFSIRYSMGVVDGLVVAGHKSENRSEDTAHQEERDRTTKHGCLCVCGSFALILTTQLLAQPEAVLKGWAGVLVRVKSGSSPVVAVQARPEQSPTADGSWK